MYNYNLLELEQCFDSAISRTVRSRGCYKIIVKSVVQVQEGLPRDKVLVVRGECDAEDPAGVTRQRGHKVSVGHVVDLHVTVVGGRKEALRIRREGQRTDGHGVTLKLVHQFRRLCVEHIDNTVDGSTGDVLSIRTLLTTSAT